ncbi:MAG: DUF99 family protein [Nanoarchaeota archaeon]
MPLKKESRIIGIDDGPFDKFKDKEALIVGTVFRGGQYLDGILTTRVSIDGFDATYNIIQMIKKSKWKSQIRAIMLDGIAVAGFNVINIKNLHKETGIPVIVIIRQYPDYEGMFRALKKLGMNEKIKLIETIEKPEKVNTIYIQREGISIREALALLKITCTHAKIPEPVRIAHIIASGLSTGESKGAA